MRRQAEQTDFSHREWIPFGLVGGRRTLYAGVVGHLLVGIAHLATSVQHLYQPGRFAFEGALLLGLPLALFSILRFVEPLSSADSDYWRLVVWGVAATTATFLITALFVVSLRFEGVSLAHPGFIVILAADVGALFGVLGGIQEVRVRTSVRRAQRAEVRAHFSEKNRKSMLFLNRMLRHHVLNGLAVVLGKTEQVADEVPESGQEHLETIRTRSRGMVDYVEDIHSATAALADAMEPERCDVSAVLAAARRSVQQSYPEAEIDADVPDELYIRGTANLRQVFRHLIENGIVHNDSETPHVRLRASAREETVRVTIADNGPGISEASKRAYFEDGGHGEDSLGEGIGLYLAESVVTLCDGQIWIEDNDPEGTRVRIALPTAEA
jgi:signal transduction histidine kinase